MVAIFDPATQWALMIVVSVVTGTFLLIAIALVRRWQQIRYSHYVHSLQLQYRPVLAKVLSGARSPAYIETLRELPLAHLEILLEPLSLAAGCRSDAWSSFKPYALNWGSSRCGKTVWPRATGRRDTRNTGRITRAARALACLFCCGQRASGTWGRFVIGRAGRC